MNKIQPAQGSSKSTPPKGFSQDPHTVTRDSSVSIPARLLWVILNGRQGQNPSVRVGLKPLAIDLGVSTRSVMTYLQELQKAQLLTIKRTGRTNFYSVIKPASDEKAFTSDVKQASLLQSNKPREIKTSKQLPALSTERPSSFAAAAKSEELEAAFPTAEPLQVLAYTETLPKYLQPADSNPKVAQLVHEGLRHGWEATELAKAVQAAGNYSTAHNPPGLAISKLKELAAMSPSEWNTAKKVPMYDPINECEHGKLKVYGCDDCRAIYARLSQEMSATA